MRITETQLTWLKWLHENGGSGYVEKQWVIANGERSLMGSSISFLNLVVKGALDVKRERLVISAHGRRLLGLPASGNGSAEGPCPR